MDSRKLSRVATVEPRKRRKEAAEAGQSTEIIFVAHCVSAEDRTVGADRTGGCGLFGPSRIDYGRDAMMDASSLSCAVAAGSISVHK